MVSLEFIFKKWCVPNKRLRCKQDRANAMADSGASRSMMHFRISSRTLWRMDDDGAWGLWSLWKWENSCRRE